MEQGEQIVVSQFSCPRSIPRWRFPPQASSMGKGGNSFSAPPGSRLSWPILETDTWPVPETDVFTEPEPVKEQVLRHDADRLWFVHGKAYDLSEFVAQHPGKSMSAF
jgi:hypothetical protein